jgi:hypothetical protein
MGHKWPATNGTLYDKMWQAAWYWLPPVLAGQCIKARLIFYNDLESIQSVTIRDL